MYFIVVAFMCSIEGPFLGRNGVLPIAPCKQGTRSSAVQMRAKLRRALEGQWSRASIEVPRLDSGWGYTNVRGLWLRILSGMVRISEMHNLARLSA